MRALADAAGRRPTAPELSARAEAWRPWRAYAALHLWSSETPKAAAAQERVKTVRVRQTLPPLAGESGEPREARFADGGSG